MSVATKTTWYQAQAQTYSVVQRRMPAAFLARAIGQQECPEPSEWVAFTCTSAIVTVITGKPLPLPDERFTQPDLEAWNTVKGYSRLTRPPFHLDFLAVMLTELEPTQWSGGPDRPERRSSLATFWLMSNTHYVTRPICRLLPELIQTGETHYHSFHSKFKEGIDMCAEIMPLVLPPIVEHVRQLRR